MNKTPVQKASGYLKTLCIETGNRSVGSPGNVDATHFFEKTISSLGWEIEKHELDVMDWDCGKAVVSSADRSFPALASPYSRGCHVEAELVCISSVRDLEMSRPEGKIVLLHGEIAREQIMPKNFVFYNPESHRHIVSLLEQKQPAAIICATGHNPVLAGGVYPFPLIEDGDFDIPSVYMKDTEGESLVHLEGNIVKVDSSAKRIQSKAYNLSAFKGNRSAKRIVITAHIDAKKGTPGAIDNATGVVVLLLAAELLRDYKGKHLVEIAPFNGEDYYAVPGQMDYIRRNEGTFRDIVLDINIDGAGYHEGDTAFSFYGVPGYIRDAALKVISGYDDAATGPEWPQGDHSIFVQFGVPAIAVSSMWFTTNMETQTITHTDRDRPEIIDIGKTVHAAEMIARLVEIISGE